MNVYVCDMCGELADGDECRTCWETEIEYLFDLDGVFDCPDCHDTGAVETGQVDWWQGPILVACPHCSATPVLGISRAQQVNVCDEYRDLYELHRGPRDVQ